MTTVLMVCALVVVSWFAAGTFWNVRKGSAVMKWMHGGLPLIGERTTVRWLGSTSVEMSLQHANPPFERVVVVIFLEPRDLPWMWALSRGWGRRDTLIVRGILRDAPRSDVEVLDRSSWSGRDAMRRIIAGDWLVREPSSPGELSVYYKTPAGLALGDAMIDLSRGAGLTVRRLSVLRNEHAFQVHVALPSTTAAARALFGALQTLAQRATA
jgi:hypothetical protein